MQQQLSVVQKDITDLKVRMHLSLDSSLVTMIEQTLKESTIKFQESVQKKKLSKLRRVTLDFCDDKVYFWRWQPSETHRNKKQVHSRDHSFYTSGSSSYF